jgi:uncharacterized membrane protein
MNTRETATLVWSVLALVFALAIPSLRTIVRDGLRILRQPVAAVLLASTTLLAASATVALDLLGYWRALMIPATVAWFLGTAIAGTFSMGGVGELQRLVARAVALTALIEFVANAYTFPLPVELLLVPGVVVLVLLASFADLRPEFAIVRAPLRALCIALFLGTLTPTVVFVVQHVGQLASAERAREFLLPLVLTIAFIPYLYGVRMVVAWQTALSMLKGEMQDRPSLLKKARRALISSCRVSLSRIQMFEPQFRLRLAAATSEEDIHRTINDFERAAAERPRRTWRESFAAVVRVGVRELLPGAGNSNIFVRSVALADRVQGALAAAAASMGATEEEMSELLDRLNLLNELGGISPVSRAEVIETLSARGRSTVEIEAIAPELGKLATLHATDVVRLAGELDSLLRLAGLPAAESARIAGELHAISVSAALPIHDTVQAFVVLLGGADDDEPQASSDA